jgi:hypothetical protein
VNVNDLFGTEQLADWPDYFRLLCRFGLDLCFTSIIVWGVYYRLYRSREFVFTYYVFNIITFGKGFRENLHRRLHAADNDALVRKLRHDHDAQGFVFRCVHRVQTRSNFIA